MIDQKILFAHVVEPIIITTTSTIGAYFLVRGASCYLGHYYNEFTVISMINAGLLHSIDPYYWGYVICFVAISAVGIWY